VYVAQYIGNYWELVLEVAHRQIAVKEPSQTSLMLILLDKYHTHAG